MNDYIFPDVIAKAMRKPSQRTLMESGLIGLLMIIIITFFTSCYIIFFTQMSLILKIFMGIGEIGILLFMISNLITNYVQYYQYKLMMGMYPNPNYVDLTKSEEVKNE